MDMEALIRRAALALWTGIPEEDVADLLHADGVSNEDAFLAIKAATVLVAPSRDTIPDVETTTHTTEET